MYSSRVSEGAATSRRGIFNSLRRAAGRCNPLQCGRCVDVSDRAVPRPNLRFGRRQFPMKSGTWNPKGIPTFLQPQLTQ